MGKENILTVVIPSYNRKKELMRLMEKLKMQTNQCFNIIISDNSSDKYDIYEILEEYMKFFDDRIRIYRNDINIGASANICGVFKHVKTQWVWLMGDDDIPEKNAIGVILDNLDDKLCVLHFSLYDLSLFMNDFKDISSLPEFINFYSEMNHGKNKIKNCQGDLICMSEIVYNWDICKKYYEKQNYYTYSKVSQILPFLYSLNDRNGIYRIINKKIIDVDDKNQHWKMGPIMLGMSTFSHIEFNITKKEREKLNLLVAFKYPNVLRYWLNGQIKREYIVKIYDGIYKNCLSMKDKVIYKTILLIKPNGLLAKMIINYKDKKNSN